MGKQKHTFFLAKMLLLFVSTVETYCKYMIEISMVKRNLIFKMKIFKNVHQRQAHV